MRTRHFGVIAVVAVVIGALSVPSEARGPCGVGMAYVELESKKSFCIDRWEASVVEIRGGEQVAHPATQPVTNLKVRAVSQAGVIPQGYISKNEAEEACKNAHKRLCTGEEWGRACRGRNPTKFPYGDERKAGYCNDSGRAPIASLHPELVGDAVYASVTAMNDPRINAARNTVARTGRFPKCKSAFNVFDMVGNLHEWVSDVHEGNRGTFRGGYYQDTHENGDGCAYSTVAHDVSYHDYSTGFRCCKDPG